MKEVVPSCIFDLPMHDYIHMNTPVNAIKQEVLDLLRHQHLIHCSPDTLKGIHNHVNGVPNLDNFSNDDIHKCSVCLQAKNTKTGPGKKSLSESVTQPYQGLYIDHAFSGQIKYDKKGEVIEESCVDVKGMNGETA